MATLYKHGELGQIERLDCKLAYCADGKILRNDGDGWKCWRKLKAGIDPRAHFEEAKKKYAEKLRDGPAFSAWRDLLHSLVSFRCRNLVVRTIGLMPQDPDGVWAELSDYGFMFGEGEILSIDEACALCAAYRAAMAEARSKAQPEPETTMAQA